MPPMDAHHHQLTVDIPPGDLWLRGDVTKLTQVLENLLTNAAKYTPEGGLIKLTVRQEGKQVFTSVRDDGAGLLEHPLT